MEITTGEDSNLWIYDLARDVFARLTFGGRNLWPVWSQDGRWIAYASYEAGRSEIYAAPSTGAMGKWLISTEGGMEPMWSPTGSELFYREGDKVLALRSRPMAAFSMASHEWLFEGPYEIDGNEGRDYDVSSDGRHFLMVKAVTAPVTRPMMMVLNWSADIARMVSAR